MKFEIFKTFFKEYSKNGNFIKFRGSLNKI